MLEGALFKAIHPLSEAKVFLSQIKLIPICKTFILQKLYHLNIISITAMWIHITMSISF